MSSGATKRLLQASGHVVGRATGNSETWDPDSDTFPSLDELPEIRGAPKGAAWFWGKDDNLGRINLLTPRRVKQASECIQTGEVIPVNLPLDIPKVPSFNRAAFEHRIIDIGRGLAFDDAYALNTQSGTQWDGFRHFAHFKSGLFYNGTRGEDISGSTANDKASIQYISQHGIAGRGILLDFTTYARGKGVPYDKFSHHEISFADLMECARGQGLDPRPQALGGDIRPGDILFVRSGWIEAYYSSKPEERAATATRKRQECAGLGQAGGMLEWLHDCYFAAVAGDAPSFEAWPSKHGFYLHEYLLALWGVPIGEMLDLERLSERCQQLQRWTFFFTSSPANCPNGVASHVNGMAIL